MKVKEYVIKLRDENTELRERLDKAVEQVQTCEKAIKALGKVCKNTKEQVASLTELLNRALSDISEKARQKEEPQAVADDGDSWDPSLGPRKKRNTSASAVAAQDRVFVKKRATDPKAAKKDNR